MVLPVKLQNLLFLLVLATVSSTTNAFQQGRTLQKPGRSIHKDRRIDIQLQMAGGGPEEEDSSTSPLSRVLSPKIDDPALPVADALVAQIIGPTLQVFWLKLQGAPSPSWLKPIFADTLWQLRGSLLAPTLIHGAALSCCWLLGCLAARAYEEEAMDPTIAGYETVLWRIFQAGCFACGVLIFSTQMDLLLEFGRFVQPGESEEIDVRILSAWVEVINDIFFEILALVPVRLFLAASIARDKI